MTDNGAVFIADTENNRIQYYQTQTFSPATEAFGNDDPRSTSYLRSPKSVKRNYNPGTSLLVADTGNSRAICLRIDYNSSKPTFEYLYSFGQGLFQELSDVSVNKSNGQIAAVDSGVHQVSIHDPEGRVIGFCQQPTFQLNQPSAITYSPRGEIFVADTGNGCIRRFQSDGQYIGTLGKKGSAVGQFSNVRGLSFDSKGYLYAADEYNNRVQVYSPDLSHVSSAVTSIPLPKGVACGNNQLIVTAADNQGYVKVYYP